MQRNISELGIDKEMIRPRINVTKEYSKRNEVLFLKNTRDALLKERLISNKTTRLMIKF